MTKTKRIEWEQAISAASNALNDLAELQGDLQLEFDEWSEARQQSDKGQAVQSLLDIDISGWVDELDSIEGAFDMLKFRWNRRLATVKQARLLERRGHPNPWRVPFDLVNEELENLRSRRPLRVLSSA